MLQQGRQRLPLQDDYDLDRYNDATGWETAGPEGVVSISLRDGQILHVTYRHVLQDASVYILDDGCDADDAEEGSDETFFGEAEELEYLAEGDELIYLVLDSFNPEGGRFPLVIDIEGFEDTAYDTATDTAASADTAGHSDTAGETGAARHTDTASSIDTAQTTDTGTP